MLDPSDPATDALTRATAGQFSIDREIGRGGMGVVYLGADVQLHRPVAIKTLPPHLAADARVRQRFLREARTAAALSHANIVPIYAAAEQDKVVYFAMKYINGESLAERIARVGALSAGEVVSLLKQLASALGYAHANGVVHRDIKAENVLLDSETGRAMLTDFGIARLTETQTLTATGTVLGTVQYMSPEQVSGDQLDGRSDLYSLGILAFLALCGRFPFERPTPSAIVVAHVTTAPPNLCSIATNVPPALGDIVDRLLSKSPGDRYADGDALRAALDALRIDNSAALVPPRAGNARVAAGDDEVMSSADAQQVWARAAELQAHTGLVVPPSQFKLDKTAVSSETAGFNAAIVRASAVDAGIDARYVDRALVERRGVAVQRSASAIGAVVPIADASRPKNRFLGATTRIDLETSFAGELSESALEEAVDEIRRGLGELVAVTAVGRTLTVTSAGTAAGGSGRQLQISVVSKNGRTTIRAFEDLKNPASVAVMGMTVGGGFAATMFAMFSIFALFMPVLAVGGFATILAGAYGLARRLYSGTAKNREEELRTTIQRVVMRAQDSLKDPSQTPRLPRG